MLTAPLNSRVYCPLATLASVSHNLRKTCAFSNVEGGVSSTSRQCQSFLHTSLLR